MRISLLICLFFWKVAAAEENVLNIYAWSEEIPYTVIKAFKKETGITVNYASFDNNEVMLAKLRTNSQSYDLVEPSSYYIPRMVQQGMLEPLSKEKIPNFKNLDPFFLDLTSDPHNTYSLPFLWGVTGIVINTNYYPLSSIHGWADLFAPKYKNQLLLLDEARAIFSTALRKLHYSINEKNAHHIHAAYLALKQLMPNVRLFNSDAVTSILIDEDANIGMAWNADFLKAKQENPHLAFIFPDDGFEIWVDSFVLLKNSVHKANAYLFLNFLLRPEIASYISQQTHYATANLSARKYLPVSIQNNPILYPSYATLKKGEFQSDMGDASLMLEKYWELLKMGG